MKKLMNCMLCAILLVAGMSAWQQASAQKAQHDAMEKMADGTYVVNTTSLASNVKGYRGTTPLKIYIKKDKVEKIEAIRNQETPKYFVRVKQQMLKKWDGKKVDKALKMKVDGLTGATMSCDAVKENVKRGLEYYQKNK